MSQLETDAYYWQILYYHLLALGHILFGESLFPIFFFQTLSLLITGGLLFQIARWLTKKNGRIKSIWPLLLLAMAPAIHPLLLNYAFQLYPIGALIITATIFLLLISEAGFIKNKRWWLFIVPGLSMGLAIVTRVNFLTWLPFVLIWLIISFRKKCLLPLLAFFIGLILALSPFVIRNYLVAHKWRLISSSSSTINFVQGTPIPNDYVPSSEQYEAVIKRLRFLFDGRAHPVVRWILDDPLAYLRLLSNKFIHLIGFYGEEINFWMLIPFILFVTGSFALLIKPQWLSPALKRKDYLITGLFIWTQIITVIMFSVSSVKYHVILTPVLLLFSFWPLLLIEKLIRNKPP